jgi:anthranilate synthase component 1
VQVEQFLMPERFSHVTHLVSEVAGTLRDGVGPLELLETTFPCGTVSGAPKVRAMQLIAELEGYRRGAYAGAVGYVVPGGDLDTCITIRTVVLAGGTAYLQAGAGIVADSDPAAEYEECLNKLAALETAIDLAEGSL